ncbi:MAG: hypothetical protein CL613_03030 [Aquimarina sp.]|mgnify:CR=1 FL=1|nr:hypothetical protein [Aquimarina sp.]
MKYKKWLRRLALIFFIILACLIPVPLVLNKRKEGQFNDDHQIELSLDKEDKTENEKSDIDYRL